MLDAATGETGSAARCHALAPLPPVWVPGVVLQHERFDVVAVRVHPRHAPN
jgi:hypothetical protein